MIEIKNLNKYYGKFHVLKNLDLNLEKGEIVALMGPNGSGKTTLMKSILGLVIPDKGEIKVNQISVKNNSSYRKIIGYMPQIANYPENLKVSELFKLIRDIRGGDDSPDKELIADFRIEEIYNKNFGQLSGGYKQRVTAAIAFMHKPSLLILDEPTSSLDPLSSEIMKSKILKEKKESNLIFVSSHIASEVELIADRIIYMLEGKIILNTLIKNIKNGATEFKLGKALKDLIDMKIKEKND
ncbi:MAG: putative ABC transporter ATP-binding protein YxlF [Ignavibacteria bacterium]|nr:putative ABC transporter ATP-binding protein YxlF [Ignavibacteria bacterium]